MGGATVSLNIRTFEDRLAQERGSVAQERVASLSLPGDGVLAPAFGLGTLFGFGKQADLAALANRLDDGREKNSSVIDGTEGDDIIVGTDGDDTISGLGGNDDIRAGDGDDTIDGGDGDDTLIGGNGADSIVGAVRYVDM